MKLYHNPASPFVRKVCMVAQLKGLADRIELVDSVLTPVSPDSNVIQDNPIGKIPALEIQPDRWLYDSRVICEYLDEVGSGVRLFPNVGEARWIALRRQALGDGICDAAILVRYERLVRPEVQQSEPWIDGQLQKVSRALQCLESEASQLGQGDNIGELAIACALGYLDFRYADMDWRGNHPGLSDWAEPVMAKDFFTSTSPTA